MDLLERSMVHEGSIWSEDLMDFLNKSIGVLERQFNMRSNVGFWNKFDFSEIFTKFVGS